MAKRLKCWKRIPRRSGAKWKHKGGEDITIYRSSQTGKWNLESGDRVLRRFDKKTQAVKFAENFMKKHNRCYL